MAGEAQQINAKISIPGKTESKFQRMLTLEMICDWIRKQGMDEYTTNGLIELASKYPNQALPSFRKNFNLMIQRVRQKRKKECDIKEIKTQSASIKPEEIKTNRTKIQLEELEDGNLNTV
jgi:hypothetical protein